MTKIRIYTCGICAAAATALVIETVTGHGEPHPHQNGAPPVPTNLTYEVTTTSASLTYTTFTRYL